MAHRFRAHDVETLRELYRHYNEDIEVRIRIAADARENIRNTIQSDQDTVSTRAGQGWQKYATAETKDSVEE